MLAQTRDTDGCNTIFIVNPREKLPFGRLKKSVDNINMDLSEIYLRMEAGCGGSRYCPTTLLLSYMYLCNRLVWKRCKGLNLYSGGALFESRPGNRQLWLKSFQVFSQSLEENPGLLYIVTCIPIVRQWLHEHITAQANARNGRTSTARQRTSQHASLTIEAVFSAWSVQSCYKEVFSSIKWSEESSFGTQVCRDMSLELNWVESSELSVAEYWQERRYAVKRRLL